MYGVIQLTTDRVELSILGQIIGVGVREEDKLRRVDLPGNVVQCSMSIEERREEIGVLRFARSLINGTELMAPTEIRERIDIGLVVIEHGITARVVRDLKARARGAQVETEDVVAARCELDLAEAKAVCAIVMKVFNIPRRGIEGDRLAAHAAELPRSREEEAPRATVRAEAQRLPVEATSAAGDGVVPSDIATNFAMKTACRDSRRDVDDCCILIAIFGIPTAGLESDLVDDLRIEQLVETS